MGGVGGQRPPLVRARRVCRLERLKQQHKRAQTGAVTAVARQLWACGASGGHALVLCLLRRKPCVGIKVIIDVWSRLLLPLVPKTAS